MLSEENIRGRYERFGGNFRHVKFVADCQFFQDKEIRLLLFPQNLNKLLHDRDIGPLEASSWICQYDVVRTGEQVRMHLNNTRSSASTMPSEARCREHIGKVDLHARIAFLIREDEAKPND